MRGEHDSRHLVATFEGDIANLRDHVAVNLVRHDQHALRLRADTRFATEDSVTILIKLVVELVFTN